MAVLSSLLGIGQQQPVAGPAIATTAFPAELAPYYKDILSKSQALYEDRTAEGYQPYQGPTMAEFTPEQQQAFTGIAGLAGQQAPKFAEAEQLTRQAAAPIATADIEQFMNPYQQAVVDIEKREAQKQFEQKTLPSIRAAQVAQGSFGGTRGTLLEAQTLAEQDRLLADIQARGSQQAFTQALQQAEAQRARQGQAAAQLATMAPQAFKAQLGELGAVQTVGEEKQRQAQTALNEAYKQFIEERQFPQQSLGQYQAVVQAQPASQMLETVQYAPPPPPLGQQLLGGLGTLVGTYGAFGGFSPGGLFGKSAKTGGGIEDLPVVEKSNGGGFSKFLSFLQPSYFKSRDDIRNRRFNINRQTNIDSIPTAEDFTSGALRSAYNPQLDMGNYDAAIKPDIDDFTIEYDVDKYVRPVNPYEDIDYLLSEDAQSGEFVGGLRGGLSPTDAEKLEILKRKYEGVKGKVKGALGKAGDVYDKYFKGTFDVAPGSGAAADIDAIKGMSREAFGEFLDSTQAIAVFGADRLNELREYMGKPKYKFSKDPNLSRKGVARALNIPELAEDKKIKDIYFDENRPEDSLIKKLADQDKKDIPALKNLYNRLLQRGVPIEEINKQVEEKANELKSKLKKGEKTSQLGTDDKDDGSKTETDDKTTTEQTTEDGTKVITNVNPNEVNKQQEKEVKQKEEKVNKLKVELDENPKDTKTKSKLQTARDDYLEALKKQKGDLGKQKDNIDDARRKSMFEFLAKVSAKYGQGATLPEAAASELDSAAKRTRQLDQAALDLKGKQREAELTAKKELVSQEEKKATAAAETAKFKLEERKVRDKRISDANKNLTDIKTAIIKNKGAKLPKILSDSKLDFITPLIDDIGDRIKTTPGISLNFKTPEGKQIMDEKTLGKAYNSFMGNDTVKREIAMRFESEQANNPDLQPSQVIDLIIRDMLKNPPAGTSNIYDGRSIFRKAIDAIK